MRQRSCVIAHFTPNQFKPQHVCFVLLLTNHDCNSLKTPHLGKPNRQVSAPPPGCTICVPKSAPRSGRRGPGRHFYLKIQHFSSRTILTIGRGVQSHKTWQTRGKKHFRRNIIATMFRSSKPPNSLEKDAPPKSFRHISPKMREPACSRPYGRANRPEISPYFRCCFFMVCGVPNLAC